MGLRTLELAVLTLGILITLLRLTNGAVPPTLTINTANVDLNEKEATRKQLSGGEVLTCVDDDGHKVRAYINSISPPTGCGLKCLQLLPSGLGYQLWFLPSQGSVQYLANTVYTLTLACTDDKDGVTTATMTVTVASNAPPEFGEPPTEPVKVNSVGSKKVYEVEATDPEGDPMTFILSTVPHTDLVEIEHSSGRIRAERDLKLLCQQKMQALVWVSDPYNTAVGPHTVVVSVRGFKQRPTVTNLDTTIYIDENQKAGKRAHKFDLDPDQKGMTFNQRSLTSGGMEAYRMDGRNMKNTIKLNYEREDTRSVKLFFNIDDDYCMSETYTLNVEVRDVPESPKYTSLRMLIMTDEGKINVPNNVFVLDDDLDEVHTHSREKSTNIQFDVDPDNGHIFTPDAVLLAPGVKFKEFNVNMRVADKDGLKSSTYRGRVRLFDINDHRPYFTVANNPLKVAAHECLPPGTPLVTLTGADDDSVYNLNNWVYFGGGGDKFGVAASGWVILTEYCKNGETLSGTATISDQGIKPGPLSGDPLEVIILCGPCPPPGDGTDGSGSGSNSSSSGLPPNSSNSDSILLWSVPTILAFATWLGLTVAFIFRFCCPCSNPCQGCCKSKTKTIQVNPEPPKDVNRPPYRHPSIAPPPPRSNMRALSPPPHPRTVSPNDPHLFGFWKETFTNQDQTTVASKRRPRAIEDMPHGGGNPEPPPNLRLGPPGYDASMPRFLPGNAPTRRVRPPPELPKESKSCTVL